MLLPEQLISSMNSGLGACLQLASLAAGLLYPKGALLAFLMQYHFDNGS